MLRLLALFPIAAVALAVLDTKAAAPQKKEPAAEGGYTFQGWLEGTTVEIRPRVTGIIEKILVKEGSAVKPGDVLAEIDPRQYTADVDVAKAKLLVAEAAGRAAAATLARTKSAVGRGILTKDDMSQSEAEQLRSEAMTKAAKAELDLAELNLSWTKIRSPIAGVVGRFNRSVGGLATADGPPLTMVVATDPLYAAFNVDEGTVLKLRRGGAGEVGKLSAAAALSDESGFPHPVTIDFIDPQFNRSSGTVLVRGAIANPTGLMSPGMSVRVRLTTAQK